MESSATAQLEIIRNDEKDIKMRELEVLLDGEPIGMVDYGKRLALAIAPGAHVVKVTNRLYSKEIEFTADAATTYRFDAGNIASGLFGIMFVVFGIGPYKVFLRAAKPD